MTSAQNLPTTPISTWQYPFKRQINQDNSVYLISVKASWWSESTHFTPCTGRTATTDREISITQQWRSKDLGTAREIFLSSLVISLDSTPDNKFWSASLTSRNLPIPPPPAVLGLSWTHLARKLTLLRCGGRGKRGVGSLLLRLRP